MVKSGCIVDGNTHKENKVVTMIRPYVEEEDDDENVGMGRVF
jgi:hypothetical protein